MLKKEKYKFVLDNLTYNQVCLIGQSIDYRINFYEFYNFSNFLKKSK